MSVNYYIGIGVQTELLGVEKKVLRYNELTGVPFYKDVSDRILVIAGTDKVIPNNEFCLGNSMPYYILGKERSLRGVCYLSSYGEAAKSGTFYGITLTLSELPISCSHLTETITSLKSVFKMHFDYIGDLTIFLFPV